MRSTAVPVFAVLPVLVLVTHCKKDDPSGPDPVCATGATTACACPWDTGGAQSGTATCLPDRTGYGTCVCPTCNTHATTACGTDGNVHFVDSCGVEEEVSVTCPTNANCVEATATTAICECDGNWTGANCDLCPENFTGAACDTCANEWTGAECNVCPPNFDEPNNCSGCSGHFTGADCDACAGHWDGASCDTCARGWFGDDCENCRFFVATDGLTTNDGLDWGAPLLSLHTALDAAEAGVTAGAPFCEVWVEAGTYKTLVGTSHVPFALRANVHVYGGFAGTELATAERDIESNPTILSGTELGFESNPFALHVVTADPGCDGAILDGFTITAGGQHAAAPTCNADMCAGGGLVIRSSGGVTRPVITVSSCTFSSNRAYLSGGAVSVGSGTVVSFLGCTFADNAAREAGGAIFLAANTGATFTDCTFTDNRVGRMAAPLDQAVGAPQGGALFVSASSEAPSTVHLDNCVFDANEADFPNPESDPFEAAGKGGAIMMRGTGADVEITGGELTNNRASRLGGALAFEGGGGANSLLIHGVELSGNQAYDNDATPKLFPGGAIFARLAAVTIDGAATVFDHNTANKGSALYLTGASTLTMSAGAFTNNFATDVLPADPIPEGGAVYVGATADATFTNTRFFNNVAGRTVGADAEGGAIRSLGTLTVTGGEFYDNLVWGTAGSSGGAILAGAGSTATLNGLSIVGGHSQGSGGALTVSAGANVTLASSEILNAYSFYGGAIAVWGGNLVVTDTIIAGNWCGGTASAGGALFTDNGVTVSIENSVIAGNWADGVDSWGGGLYLATGTTELHNCTVYANDLPARADENATTGGGNIYVDWDGGLVVRDSVMANAANTNGLAAFATSLYDIQYTISQEAITGTGTGNIQNATLDFATAPGLVTGTWAGATFHPETYDTAINGPASSWTPQALVGLYVQPDISSPRILPILGNQESFVIVPGDLSTIAGKTFRIISLKPKIGGNTAVDFIDKGGPDQGGNDILGEDPVCVRTPTNVNGCRDLGAYEYLQP